jgi:multiple sugar transport system substrate-binding protein
LPYENALGEQVRDFVAGGDLDVALIDLVWIGNFAENGWIVPSTSSPRTPTSPIPTRHRRLLPAPARRLRVWDGVTYGLPFDNYSGLLFYNRCMLEEAGFDGPPETWEELKDDLRARADPGRQIRLRPPVARNETQSADSFARMLWPFGGSFLDDGVPLEPHLGGELAGLQFRQDLMKYMPEGIVAYDHAEAVNALAQGDVAMITEWSSFYSTLTNPDTSQIVDCLGVAPEPAGPAGRKPALGGFSLAVPRRRTRPSRPRPGSSSSG